MPRTVKVAVIGTGLAGLTTAYLLSQKHNGDDVEFEVHLFEKESSTGMDSSSISIKHPAGEDDWRVDVPMRSFQGGYYRNVIALYRALGLQMRRSNFSYSFSALTFSSTPCSTPAITTTMIYDGASGRKGVSKPAILRASSSGNGISALVGQLWSWAAFLYLMVPMIICFLYMLIHSLPFWRPTSVSEITFGQWALEMTPSGYFARLAGWDLVWRKYVETILVPTLSAVCTAPEADVRNHPVEEFLDYFWLTFGTDHYVVVGGVRNVVSRLTRDLKHLHLSSPVMSIVPDPFDIRCVAITCLAKNEPQQHAGFHHVVMATQASSAVTIIGTYRNALGPKFEHRKLEINKQLQCLRAFQCLPTVVINHTDPSLLPDHEDDVRDLNLITLAPKMALIEWDPKDTDNGSVCVPSSYTMATHVQKPPEHYLADQPTVYQTTNPILPPKKESILSVAKLQRAVVTMDSKRALGSLCVQDQTKWWQCPYEAGTRLGDLQGALTSVEPTAPGIWICGSYAHVGIPLLEGCVVSARNVVEQGIMRREGLSWSKNPWNA